MKLERSRNAKRNMVYSSLNKILMLLLPFLVQSAFIRALGAEYLGLRGMFSSILQVLSLAELGFGSALVYSMYDAIARDDKSEICGLLHLYKRIYRRIGLIVFIVGTALVPFLKYLVKGDYPQNINIYIVYILYLINTVLSYWMFAYKASLLNAYQRLDVVSVINTISNGIMQILQIGVLIWFRNFYAYLCLLITATALNNLLTKVNVDRMFPEYRGEGSVSAETLKSVKTKVSGLLIYKICGVTRNSMDSIFVSMFLGLTLTAVYNNYYYVLTSVMSLLSIVTSSILAGIGNSIASESLEKNYGDFIKIDFIYMVLAGWCTTCIVCLYQPFMRLWAGPDLVLPFSSAILFALYFYILCMGNIRALYTDAAGLWWENRNRMILESLVNVILNYLLVKKWGISGIVLATILTVAVFGYGGSALVLFKHYFKRRLAVYFKNHAIYFLAALANGVLTYGMCALVRGSDLFVLLCRGLICCMISPAFFYICYSHTHIYKNAVPWLVQKMKKRSA